MPRTVIKHPRDNFKCSLGRLAYWWLKNFVVYGPGSVRGQPIHFGPERLSELFHMYALDSDTGKRLYSSAFLSKAKGTDKSGFAGYLGCFEAAGPCRFAGWAKGGETYTFLGKTYLYKRGEPMGRPVLEPILRVFATEEDQTGNVYDVVLYNFQSGPLAQLEAAAFDGYIELPGHGFIYPSTSGAASKDGGKETFCVYDETHLFNVPRLRNVYSTVKRNMTKRPLEEPWSLETTTMYAPGEDSIAERTYLVAEKIQEGGTRKQGLLFIHQFGVLRSEDFGDEDKLRRALLEAMGEASEWLDPELVINEHFYDPREDIRDSIRYYLNARVGAASGWVESALVEQSLTDDVLEPGDEIALGFDGSLTGDSTVLVACRLRDNLVQLLHIQEAPLDPKQAKMWAVDKGAVDAAVHDARTTYVVKAFHADPPFYQDEIELWETEFGEDLAPATREHPIMWWTSREYAMIKAVERAETLFASGGIRVSRSMPQLVRHVHNARAWERRGGRIIGKELKNSPKKMDGAMGLILAVEAAATARTYVPKPKTTKDTNHGLILEVPSELLIQGRNVGDRRRNGHAPTVQIGHRATRQRGA